MRNNERLNPLGVRLFNLEESFGIVERVENIINISTIDEDRYYRILNIFSKIMLAENENIFINLLPDNDYLYLEFEDYVWLVDFLRDALITIQVKNENFDYSISSEYTARYYNMLQQLLSIGFRGIEFSENYETTLRITEYNNIMIGGISAYLTNFNSEVDMRILRNCKINIDTRNFDFNYIFEQLGQLSEEGMMLIDFFNRSFVSIEMYPFEFAKFIQIMQRFNVSALN